MRRKYLFWENLQQEFKCFIFYCLLFSLFRLSFIIVFDQSSNIEEIMTTLWYGFRLSLKTAGAIMLLSCVLCMLPQLIFLRWPANKIRIRWHYLVIIFFTICFATRLTYYTIFNNGFDMMIINGLYDDKWAILITAIQEYQLLLKLPAAILGGIILAHPLKMWLKKKTYSGRYLMHSKDRKSVV